jgi:hypothetical protein
VSRGNRDGMYLTCPDCGDLRAKPGLLGLKVVHCGTEDDDLRDFKEDHKPSLRIPAKHPLTFAIIFVPVIATIAVGSYLHEFTFFYLVIPGFWCYGIGSMLLQAIYSGAISDNHGTALRSRSPARFWSKFAIWALFYLIGAAVPIGFALQARNEAQSSESRPASVNPSNQ